METVINQMRNDRTDSKMSEVFAVTLFAKIQMIGEKKIF